MLNGHLGSCTTSATLRASCRELPRLLTLSPSCRELTSFGSPCHLHWFFSWWYRWAWYSPEWDFAPLPCTCSACPWSHVPLWASRSVRAPPLPYPETEIPRDNHDTKTISDSGSFMATPWHSPVVLPAWRAIGGVARCERSAWSTLLQSRSILEAILTASLFLSWPLRCAAPQRGPNFPAVSANCELQQHCRYQGMFNAFTAALVCGGTINRVPPGRFIFFISIWSLFIYIPIARWSWYPDGWSAQILQTMDFAGGTPVHICSGSTVAAFACFVNLELNGGVLGLMRSLFSPITSPKKSQATDDVESGHTTPEELNSTGTNSVDVAASSHTESASVSFPEPGPYNLNYLTLGTALLWFGWAGFNGGSALGGNLRASSAWFSTHIAACAGGTMAVLLAWTSKSLEWLDQHTNSNTNRNSRTAASGEVTVAPVTGDGHPHQSGNPDGPQHIHATAEERESRRLGLVNRQTVTMFCEGAVIGLVAITPGAGFVSASMFPFFVSGPTFCVPHVYQLYLLITYF